MIGPARAPDGRLFVSCDTSVLLNFLNVRRIDLLAHHPDYRFAVTEDVRDEVRTPEQRSALDQAIEAGDIALERITDRKELALFAELEAAPVDRGEASAIAVAENRRWCVAVDEGGRTRREVERRLGASRHLTTPGILLRCIQAGVLSVEEADAIKDELAQKRFRVRFGSFAELLDMPGPGDG